MHTIIAGSRNCQNYNELLKAIAGYRVSGSFYYRGKDNDRIDQFNLTAR